MTGQEFAHIGINCRDPMTTEEFYTKHFGFKRARVIPLGNDQIVFLKTKEGGLYLEIFKASEEPPAPPTMNDGPNCPGFRHLAFKVDDVDAKPEEMVDDAKIAQGPMNFDDFHTRLANRLDRRPRRSDHRNRRGLFGSGRSTTTRRAIDSVDVKSEEFETFVPN